MRLLIKAAVILLLVFGLTRLTSNLGSLPLLDPQLAGKLCTEPPVSPGRKVFVTANSPVDRLLFSFQPTGRVSPFVKASNRLGASWTEQTSAGLKTHYSLKEKEVSCADFYSKVIAVQHQCSDCVFSFNDRM